MSEETAADAKRRRDREVYAALGPEGRAQKSREMAKARRERIAAMSPDERQAYLADERARVARYRERYGWREEARRKARMAATREGANGMEAGTE